MLCVAVVAEIAENKSDHKHFVRNGGRDKTSSFVFYLFFLSFRQSIWDRSHSIACVRVQRVPYAVRCVHHHQYYHHFCHYYVNHSKCFLLVLTLTRVVPVFRNGIGRDYWLLLIRLCFTIHFHLIIINGIAIAVAVRLWTLFSIAAQCTKYIFTCIRSKNRRRLRRWRRSRRLAVNTKVRLLMTAIRSREITEWHRTK